MMTATEKLIQEIVSNSREDRGRLVEVANSLKSMLNEVKGRAPDDDLQPDVALNISEEMSRISDSLTKINQQLVELVKLDKKQNFESKRPISEKDREDLYENIEHPGKGVAA